MVNISYRMLTIFICFPSIHFKVVLLIWQAEFLLERAMSDTEDGAGAGPGSTLTNFPYKNKLLGKEQEQEQEQENEQDQNLHKE